jgi:hypothetical protein
MKRVVTGSRRPAQYKIGNWAEYDAAARQPDCLGDAGGGNFTIVGQYLLGLLPDDTSPY